MTKKDKAELMERLTSECIECEKQMTLHPESCQYWEGKKRGLILSIDIISKEF
jgi:hypothetical protein